MKMQSLLLVAALAGSAAVFAAPGAQGLNRDYFEKHKGGLAVLKTGNASRPAPTGSDVLKSSEGIDWKGSGKQTDFADNYGQCVYGLVIPEKSGEYVFYVAGDDMAELFLSSDENAKNAKSVCRTSGWTPTRNFLKNPSQKSAPVKLEAGKKYYIEGIMIENGGGDNLAIAWQVPGTQKPEIIQAKNLQTVK